MKTSRYELGGCLVLDFIISYFCMFLSSVSISLDQMTRGNYWNTFSHLSKIYLVCSFTNYLKVLTVGFILRNL